jgi:hypothetical protein
MHTTFSCCDLWDMLASSADHLQSLVTVQIMVSCENPDVAVILPYSSAMVAEHTLYHHHVLRCCHEAPCAGLRQSFVTVGSLLGSAVASAVFVLSGASYTTTFAAAAIPPCLALVWLAFAFRGDLQSQREARVPPPTVLSEDVEDSSNGAASSESGSEGSGADSSSAVPGENISLTRKFITLVTAFSPAYWQSLLVLSVLYFGRFDFTWVTLRAKAVRC